MNVLATTLIVAGALSLGGIVVGALLTDRDDDLWLEVARAGVQVLAVGLIGGAVAAAWRLFEQVRSDRQKREADERERERQVHEQQLSIFRKVVGSYNEVKAIRRTLRSLGLRASTGELSEAQVSGFRDLMLRLNVVQLSFEALKREVGETNIFEGDTVDIVKRLHDIEDYLNGALNVWENSGSLIEVGSERSVVSSGLDGLIGSARRFKDGVVSHQREITRLIHEHLFGPSSELAKRELERLDQVEDAKAGAANAPGAQ